MAELALPVLHPRFRNQGEFRIRTSARMLPFRFTALDAARLVATNLVGEHTVLNREELLGLATGQLDPQSPLYAELVSKHFLLDGTGQSALDLLAAKYATRLAHLAEFTGLHIFVVTLRCDHSCPYCQVSRVSSDKAAFDMSIETADRAIETMFRSPNPCIKVEFQGGEPLLNFELIRHITLAVKSRNVTEQRNVQFVIATNLAQMTDEVLEFCREHSVHISTSLDGPAALHNANRPRPGNDSYQRAVAGINRCRESLGHDSVAALMTTTTRSLSQPEAIIDEYVVQGFSSIFLRWLSPYGFARKSERALGYPVREWNAFYERGLRYILTLNRNGVPLREDYAAIVLRKVLTPFAGNYVDLQSPAALGIGVAVYNYDGDVYASDEGRMLAVSGDTTFRLGSLHTDSYESLFGSERLIDLLDATMTEATPQCVDCAFEPWCGTDPAFHQATQGDPVGHRPTSAFCARNMFVFRLLVSLLEDDPEAREVLESWL